MSNETVETTPGLFVWWLGPGCEILGWQQSVCISPQLENTSHTASAPLLLHWRPGAQHLSLDKGSLGCQVSSLGLSLGHLNRSKHIWRALLSFHLCKFLNWDIKLIEVGCSSFRLSLRLFFILSFFSVLLLLNAVASFGLDWTTSINQCSWWTWEQGRESTTLWLEETWNTFQVPSLFLSA